MTHFDLKIVITRCKSHVNSLKGKKGLLPVKIFFNPIFIHILREVSYSKMSWFPDHSVHLSMQDTQQGPHHIIHKFKHNTN